MKTLFTLLLISISICSFCQSETIGVYQQSYFENTGKDFLFIKANQPNKKSLDLYDSGASIEAVSKKAKFNLSIEVNSIDKSSKEARLYLDYSSFDEFKSQLDKSREKFIEWSSVVDSSGVNDISKSIEVIDHSFRAGFFYGEWHRDSSVKLNYVFTVINDNPVLIISSDKLKSDTNQFIKSDGFVFVFSSLKELDWFASHLSIDLVFSSYSKKQEKESIFKD